MDNERTRMRVGLDRLVGRYREDEMNQIYQDGKKVQINKPTLREHGVIGTVKSFDDLTQWYWVELDQGPPWRGNYERAELKRFP